MTPYGESDETIMPNSLSLQAITLEYRTAYAVGPFIRRDHCETLGDRLICESRFGGMGDYPPIPSIIRCSLVEGVRHD